MAVSNKTRVKKTKVQQKSSRSKNKRSIKTRKSKLPRKQQKGGRVTFLPQDIVNVGRSIGNNTSGFFNVYRGLEPPASPYPTLGHPISK